MQIINADDALMLDDKGFVAETNKQIFLWSEK